MDDVAFLALSREGSFWAAAAPEEASGVVGMGGERRGEGRMRVR